MKYKTKQFFNLGIMGLGLGMVLGSIGVVTSITALMAVGLVIAGVGGGTVLGFGIKGMKEEKQAKQERSTKDFYVEHSFSDEYNKTKQKENNQTKTVTIKNHKSNQTNISKTDDFEL